MLMPSVMSPMSVADRLERELLDAVPERQVHAIVATLCELVRTCRASAKVLHDGSRCIESRIDACEIEDFAEQRFEFADMLANAIRVLGGEVPATNGLRRAVRANWLRLRNLVMSTSSAPTDAEILVALQLQDRTTIDDFDRAMQSGQLPPQTRLLIERLYGALVLQRFRLGEMARGDQRWH